MSQPQDVKVTRWSRHMRVLFTLLLLLALLSVPLPSDVSAQSDCNPAICTLTVNRSISTNDWGVTFMSDSVTLTSTSPVAHVSLGVPSPISDKLRSIATIDNEGARLQVSRLSFNETGNFQPFDVSFPTRKTGTYSFNMTMVYSGLLSLNQSAGQYALTFSPFPVTDGTLNVTQADVTVKTGDWPSPKILPINGTASGGIFTTQAKPLKAHNVTVWNMVFASSGTSQNILEISASRTITISQKGTIQVSDDYNITNRGREIQSLIFTLPRGVLAVSASDTIGRLDDRNVVVVEGPGPTTTVRFSPRFGAIKPDGSAIVLVRYQLSAQGYVSSSSPGRYTLNYQLFDNVKFVSSNFQTRILTPTGFRLDALTGQTPVVSKNEILLEVSPLTPLSDLSFSMIYQLDPFWASLAPLGWAGLLEGVLAVAVLVVASGTRAAVVGVVPSDLIRRFVGLYDEKASMRLEADKMEDDLNRGAMNKHEFKRRRRVIDLRVSEIDRSLSPIKEQLGEAQSRYQDMVKRIERAEAELQVVRSTSADLRNQYRSGRIARELYESLVGDLARRKERAQQTIDNIVITLREEAR